MRLIIFLVFTCLAGAQTCSSVNDPATHTKVGQKMPKFAVADLAGNAFSISQLKGKVALVNFWATWCAPCRQEMPRLQKEVWQNFKADKFAMVAIARQQSDKEISAFQKNTAFTFPLASDPKRVTYGLFADSGIPRSYVVGPDGTILFQSVGYCAGEFDEMVKVLKQALKIYPAARDPS